MPKPVPRERATLHDKALARVINTHGDYGLRIALEARQYDIWPSIFCAVLEQESGFRNVFGHDPVRWPQIKGGPVNRVRYLRYKALRKLGYGMQGVGPGQLTYFSYQDEADRSGGCWRVSVNIACTAALLREIRDRRGVRSWHDVYEIYNAGRVGTSDGREYSASVQRRQHKWHDLLKVVD